jgi:hypothetical protein
MTTILAFLRTMLPILESTISLLQTILASVKEALVISAVAVC